MSEALTIFNDLSPWQLWSLGSRDLDYSPTGTGTSMAIDPGQPNWMRAAMLLALASGAGLVPGHTAFASLAGTGRTADELFSDDGTAAVVAESWGELIERIDEQATQQAAELLGGADLIAEIKATLGVNITDLAGMTGVSRQTIYDWIGGGQVSDANYKRLLALRQACLDWRERADRPLGRLLRTKSADGVSLLDLLGQDPPDRALIARHLDALASKAAEQQAQRKARQARLALLSEKDQYENALTHAIPATRS
jgi:hypothetical protein